MKQKLLKQFFLIAAVLCMGSTGVWAADVWTFTDTSVWGNQTSGGKSANYKYLATGSEVWFGPDGSTATSETSNVSFKFVDDGARFNYGGTHALGFCVNYDSENDINYTKVVVPNNYRVLIDVYTGSSGRPIKISLDGVEVSSYTAENTYDYTNSTGASQTIKVYGTNVKSDYSTNTIKRIVLVDLSIVGNHSWTANAVATISGTPTNIKTYSSASNVTEYDNYSIVVDKAIYYNGSYYELNDAAFSTNVFGKTYRMGEEDAVYNYTYTKVDNCVFYGEAESIYTAGSNASTSSDNNLSNGSGYKAMSSKGGYVTLTFNVPSAGIYDIKVGMNNTNNSGRGFTYQIDEGAVSGTINVAAYTPFVQEINDQYLTAGNHTIKLNLTYSLTPVFDYVLVTQDYAFTEVVGATDFTTTDRAAESSDITMKPGDVYNVTFCNYGSEGANKNNFCVVINDAASMYADWYDYIQSKGGWDADGGFRNAGLSVTDPYQVSTDGGSTSGNTDWSTWADIRKSFVDLTIKYIGGKVTIEGNATSIDTPANIFYYGYAYTVADATADATVNLSVCLSWLGIVSIEKTHVGVTTGLNGYTTFASSSPLDLANLPSGLTAYKASVAGTTVSFTEADEAVAANTGLLLKGENATNYSIPVAATGSDISATNAFLVNTSAAAITSDETTYYFAMKKASNASDGLTFGKITSVIVPSTKAYLEVPAANFGSGSRSLSFSFGDESTGLKAIDNGQLTIDNQVYNLQGQRVEKATKGLYIVNGKKVLVK